MTDTADVERALDALLQASIADDEMQPAGPIKATPFDWEAMERAVQMTRLDREIADLKRRPLRAAYRQAIRRIGQHVYGITGSTDGMRDVLERVAAMDPKREGYRATIMDHAWDGIGEGEDRWWC